jgi:probable rRNA maturation factor
VTGTCLMVRNRQRSHRINTGDLRRIILHLLEVELAFENFDIAVHLVGEDVMTQANSVYLNHEGCTDVITFDHKVPGHNPGLQGDLMVCVPEAVRQAKQFHATWQKEVVRYIVHGTLHLCGYDDHKAPDRRAMKEMENRILGRLARQFDLNRLSAPRKKPSQAR